MSFFVIFLITLLDGIALAILTRKSFGRIAAVVNLGLIALLYLAGLFLHLDVGMYIFFAVSAALIATTAWLLIARRDVKPLLDVVRNPVFTIYASLGVVVGIAFLFAFSHDWDEMTHWALVVKNMLTYNNFGNLGDTTTMFNQYVPATGVLMYAFNFLNPNFVNGNCYAAFDVLIISLLLPLPDYYRGKTIPFFGSIVALGVTVCVLKHSLFLNLRIDALIGIMGAYIYMVYWTDRGKVSGFTLAEMTLGCFALTLAKSSGVALAAIAVVFVLLDVLIRGRQYIKPFFSRKINWVLILLPILAIVAAKVSWSVYCKVMEVRAGWNSSEMTLPAIWAYMTHPNEFQQTVNKIFWRNFFIGKPVYRAGSLQLPFVITFPLLVLATFAVWRKKQKGLAVGFGVATLVVLIVYAVINLFLYIFSFSYGESLKLASWPRYYGTALIMMALIWMPHLVDDYLGDKEASPKLAKGLWASGIAFLATFTIVISSVFCVFWKKDADTTLAPFQDWIVTLKTLEDTDSVYYCATDDHDRDVYIARFLATPTRCSGWQQGGSYAEGRSGGIYTGDPFNWDMTEEQLAEAVSKYEFFWLSKTSDEFAARYGALFDEAPQEHVLYLVTETETGVKLVPRAA